MANTLGARVLYRWSVGDCPRTTLDGALRVGWITQDEYDQALADRPDPDA